MARRKPESRLPAPYLKRILLDAEKVEDWETYPFNLPFFRDREFELEFTTPVTILVGENGTGKSTLLEAIAALAGYDEAGGGKGYRAVDNSRAVDSSGAALGEALRAHWLPKVTAGWFFRAESFFSVARYLDEAALDVGATPPDFLSWSHGEGFLRFFEERMSRQGIYFMDEPESALSPSRQIAFLRVLKAIQDRQNAQIIMATHSPLLMALPGARLLQLTRFGLHETDFRETDHFRMMQDFTSDPEQFLSEALKEAET